ncbi:MAG: beta-lactamase family protein [Myxococcales bacterium]|nr:beta-lactamase family protein [Myxococcales bacterium]
MRSRGAWWLGSLVLTLGCGRGAPGAAVSVPTPASTARVAGPGGASVVVPEGWRLGDAGRIADPAGALAVQLVERAEAEPAAAAAAAWTAAFAAPAPAVAAVEERAPDDGWDAAFTVAFAATGEAAAGEAARAEVRRRGARAWVALIPAAAADDARAAAIDAAIASLRAPGVVDEVLGGAARAPDAAARAALDRFIDDARARLAVPGAAVAITIDGRVVYEHTVGVRRLGEPAPITVDTRFLLASVTKPLTTFMEAALVDAGVVRWDQPVTAIWPGFAVGDAALTGALRLWHLSCACSGIPARDLDNIFEADVGPEARMATLREQTPTAPLGETYQYSNLMVAAGGYAAAHAAQPTLPLGDAYDQAMRRYVFAPIAMTRTTFDPAEVAAGDHASPHAVGLDGVPRALPDDIERGTRDIRPAGGAWSTLRDLSRFAATEALGGVTPEGRRVVSAANLGERRRLRVHDGDGPDSGYGLGLGVDRYHGLPILSHHGGAFGFGTTLLVLPAQRVGIVVLTNVRNGGGYAQLPFNAVVERALYEALFADAQPRAAALVAYLARARAAADAAAGEGVERAPPAAWLAALAGGYADPHLGAVTVSADGWFDAGEWKSRVGRRLGADGAAALVMLDPPFAGAALPVAADATPPAILVPDATTAYRLERRAR